MTRITGYAAVFGRIDSQADLILPGAFRASLQRRHGRIPLLWQHEMHEPVGRIDALQEDAAGLWFSATLAESARARDARALIRSGALRECSIGFLPRRARFEARDGARVRVLAEVEVVEVSLVTLAANPRARLLSVDGAPLDRSREPTQGAQPHAPQDKEPFVLSPVERRTAAGHTPRLPQDATRSPPRATPATLARRLAAAIPARA